MTDLSAERPAQEQVRHTPLSAEILNPPKNPLAAGKVQVTVTGSILGIDVAKQINQAGVSGTITPEEKAFLETELGAANRDLWSALDPQEDSLSLRLGKKERVRLTQKTVSEEQKIKPLNTNNLDPELHATTASIIELTRQNSGFLEANHPMVMQLQSYLDQMKDPTAPPTRILIATNDKESNAFSLPDGTIVFNQALINKMDTIEEIIAILGHEQVHFEKEHYKKQAKDWFKSDDIKEIVSGFLSKTGIGRVHEYHADIALISKLDNLGIDTMAFESAIRKLGAQENGEKKHRSGPQGISLIHGTETDRALNTLYAHAIVDFPSSVKGEDSRTPIPLTWKREVEDSVYFRLQGMKPGEKWLDLLEQAEPLVLDYELNQLVTIVWSIGKHYSEGERTLNIQDRDQCIKLEQVFKLFEHRLSGLPLTKDEKRKALLLCCTQGAHESFDYGLNLRRAKKLAKPFDTFQKTVDPRRLVLPSDFTPEAHEEYIKLHQGNGIYAAVGLPPQSEPIPKRLLGYSENGYARPGLYEYFIHKAKLHFEAADGQKSRSTSLENLFEHLSHLEGVLSKYTDQTTSSDWFRHATNFAIRDYIYANRHITDVGRSKLIQNVSHILAYTKKTYGLHYSFRNIHETAWYISNGSYGAEKIEQKAKDILIEKLFFIDSQFKLAFENKDGNTLAAYLKKSPEGFQEQLAHLFRHNTLNKESITFIQNVVASTVGQVQGLEELKIGDASGAALAKIGVDLKGITPEVYIQYQQMKYCLDVFAITTSGKSIQERISLYRSYLNTPQVAQFIRSLPLVLLDHLNREICNEGTYVANYEGVPIGFGPAIEPKYDLRPPSYNGSHSKGGFGHEIRKDQREVADAVMTLPLVPLLRDRLLDEIKGDAATFDQVATRYEYFRNMLCSLYPETGNDTFWGSTVEMGNHLAPFTALLLRKFTEFSFAEVEPNEAVTYYLRLRNYLPSDYDNQTLLSTFSEKILDRLPYKDALLFLEAEASENRFDFSTVNRFIEKRIHTKADFDLCKATVARALDSLIANPNKKIGSLAIADQALEIVSRGVDMPPLLEGMMSQGDDSVLKEKIAPLYWGVFVGRVGEGEREYDVQPENGAVSISGPAAHTFHTFHEVIDKLYSLNEAQKTLLLRKLLLSDGGVLTNPQYHERVSEMVVSHLEKHPALTPLFKAILTSSMNAGDPVRMFTPLAQALLPMFLQKPLRMGSNDRAVETTYKKVHEGDGVIKKAGAQLGVGWSKQAIHSLFNMSPNEVLERGLEQSPTMQMLYASYNEMIQHLRTELGIGEAALSVPKENIKIPPIEAILKIGESLGPVGVRFLQVLGQYVDLPPEYEEKFRSVYDSMNGQSKFTAFSIIERLAKTDEPTRRFMEEELVTIDEKIGGGSINTTFKITTKDASGALRQEALKVKNPNAERFVMETIIQARKIVRDLIISHPKDKLNYEIAERMLNTIEEWVLGDIRDTEFMEMDKTFSALHDGQKTSSGVTIKIGKTRQPNNLFLKREDFIEGKTLNKLLVQGLSGEPLAIAQKFVLATAEGFLTQLTVPAYTDAQGKPIYQVLSDVHPGNVIVDQQNNAVYPIDRNYFLKLSKEDVDFIAMALGPTPSQEKLAPMVSYFLGLEENSGLSLEKKQVTDQIFKSFVLDKIAGKSTNSIKMMFKFLHELDRRNIQIPLRIRILMKDVDAVNKMLQKVELPSFATYLSSVGGKKPENV